MRDGGEEVRDGGGEEREGGSERGKVKGRNLGREGVLTCEC